MAGRLLRQRLRHRLAGHREIHARTVQGADRRRAGRPHRADARTVQGRRRQELRRGDADPGRTRLPGGQRVQAQLPDRDPRHRRQGHGYGHGGHRKGQEEQSGLRQGPRRHHPLPDHEPRPVREDEGNGPDRLHPAHLPELRLQDPRHPRRRREGRDELRLEDHVRHGHPGLRRFRLPGRGYEHPAEHPLCGHPQGQRPESAGRMAARAEPDRGAGCQPVYDPGGLRFLERRLGRQHQGGQVRGLRCDR